MSELTLNKADLVKLIFDTHKKLSLHNNIPDAALMECIARHVEETTAEFQTPAAVLFRTKKGILWALVESVGAFRFDGKWKQMTGPCGTVSPERYHEIYPLDYRLSPTESAAILAKQPLPGGVG